MTVTPELVEAVIAAIAFVDPAAGSRARAESRIAADLGLDNLARVHLALELEDRCTVPLPEREVLDWETVADIAEGIARLQPKAAA